MSGNILFLVCEPCEKAQQDDFGIKLCDRSTVGWYEPTTPPKVFKTWLHKHSRCGGRHGPDHFRLGALQERNFDQPKTKTNGAVVCQASE